jgi:hypothetical protein
MITVIADISGGAGINSVFWKFAKDFFAILVTFDTLPAQSCLTGFAEHLTRIFFRVKAGLDQAAHKEDSPAGT